MWEGNTWEPRRRRENVQEGIYICWGVRGVLTGSVQWIGDRVWYPLNIPSENPCECLNQA